MVTTTPFTSRPVALSHAADKPAEKVALFDGQVPFAAAAALVAAFNLIMIHIE